MQSYNNIHDVMIVGYYMWQSQTEIEHYSVVYFECITEIDMLHL